MHKYYKIYTLILLFISLSLVGCGSDTGYLTGFDESATLYPTAYDDIIATKATENNLPVNLVKAVVQAESAGYKDAVSSQGAMGLMQLMPETADMLGVEDPFNPEENIAGGTKYLKMMVDQFGDYELALAAYNAGPQRVEEYGGIPPYKETENYVWKVMSLYRNSFE